MSDDGRGRLIAMFHPWSVGMRTGLLTTWSQSFPFPRSFAVYENGVAVGFRSGEPGHFVGRGEIESIVVGPLRAIVKTKDGGNIAAASFDIARIRQTLDAAGYRIDP